MVLKCDIYIKHNIQSHSSVHGNKNPPHTHTHSVICVGTNSFDATATDRVREKQNTDLRKVELLLLLWWWWWGCKATKILKLQSMC